MNYDLEMNRIIKENISRKSILLHSCCAPCSSYVIELLLNDFDITVLYYNPNIFPKEEYLKRKNEQIRLIKELNSKYVNFIDCDYDNEVFENIIIGLEHLKEGGKRCEKCILLRMKKTALLSLNKYDFFGTTLTVSPHKNSKMINEIGKELEEKHGVKFLYSDFKKKDGYKKSIKISKEHNLYRQNYCGCKYSIREDL
ncbi:MAG: epoxyqueuosine reductase QueH [Bacilli bacterium]|nr:epoxyqueuosine reductase QueH [Bacilli bacterium]MDD4407333.1 epoxyqueuosine reductase QueH [Bacilli bacterium]